MIQPDAGNNENRYNQVDVDYNDNSENEDAPQAQAQISKKQKRIADIEIIKQLISMKPVDVPQVEERLANHKFIKRVKEDIPSEQMHNFYRELNYQLVEAYKPVYRQGDPGRQFYIILEGTVLVMKSRDKMVGSDKLAEDDPEYQNLIAAMEPQGAAIDGSDPVQYIIQSYPSYLHIKTLRTGSSFGEVSLKLELSRTAMVVAATDVHLLWISAAAYRKILNPYFSMILDQKINLFNIRLTKYEKVPTEQIMGVILELHYRSYKAGQAIYKEGSKPSYIYFIIAGDVHLLKQVPHNQSNLPFATYGQNQMFGVMEVMNKTLRFTSAVAISPKVTMYSINKTKFFDNLGSYRVYEMMKKQGLLLYQNYQRRYSKHIEELTKERDEVYANMDKEPTTKLSNSILNHRIMQHHSVNNIRIFSQLANDDLDSSVRQIHDRTTLQRVYCNSLQGFLGKIVQDPSKQTEVIHDSIRGQSLPKIPQQQLDFVIDLNISMVSSVSMSSLLSSYSNKTDIKPVVSQISKLPKIQRDNLVMQLLKQQALRSKNPKVEFRKIDQALDLAARKIVDRSEYRKKGAKSFQINCKSTTNKDIRLLQVLNIPEVIQYKK